MTMCRFHDRLRRIVAHALVATLPATLCVSAEGLAYAQEATAAPTAPTFSNDQLDSLVAPIALYPDPLLAQLLVATTYPLDIVQAQQWLTQNSSLEGDALTEAAEKQVWDPSVQAMVLFPDVLKRMSENVKWTTDLGNAVLEDQAAVMDAVQRMRTSAKAAGKLESSEQLKVETQVVETRTIIEIQPTSPQVVYVPTYSPTVIWGPPLYPYPPLYYPPYRPGGAWVTFGVGMAVGVAISGGWGWGCGWGHGHGYGHNNITINNNNNFINNNNRVNNVNRTGNSNWQHNARQRGGVPYQNKATAQRYGGAARGDSMSTRQAQARQTQARQPQARQTQARQTQAQSFDRGSSSANRGAGGANLSNRSPSSTSANRATASRAGGGDRVGTRNVSPSRYSGGGSAFSGSGSMGNSARASSARGSASMRGASRSRRR